MSLFSILCPLHIWQSNLAIMYVKALFNSCVRIWDNSLLIPGEATVIIVVWLKFRRTGESSAYVSSRIMTDPAPLICQSNLARRQSRRYWVLVSELETWLAYLWQSRSYCWHIIKVQVHRRVQGTYHHDCHDIITNPIPHLTQSTQLLRSCVRIWDMGWLICGKATACAGMSYSFGHTSDRHPWASETETWLGYSWRSCTFHCWVCPVLWFNFVRLQLIMKVSFQLRHASTATISLRSTCTPRHSALLILVCFMLIVVSSALNQWMLCTQIVISQNTTDLGAGSLSSSASADISSYASSVCADHHYNFSNC